MVEPVVTFSEDESTLLRELGIAVFRNKLILNAQPPITKSQLDRVQQQVEGELSPDLIALWKVSFGGALDYDYEVAFGEHLYTASLRELFYPSSDHYHTLDGWIEHEIEVSQQVAEQRGKPIPERTRFVPFGGFEYLERFYVSLQPDEYGAVLIYAQGIPWKGRLNEDSVAKVANSVAELFDQLSLDEDPFDEHSDEYASGKDMVERIREIEADHPQLAEKLRQLVCDSIFDWQQVIDRTDFAEASTAEELKALRLALKYAVDHTDSALVAKLNKQSAPFDTTLRGESGVLGYAMVQQAFEIVEQLIDLDVELGDAPILFATNCPDNLLVQLIKRGVYFDEEAIYSSAETGAVDGAIELVYSSQRVEPKPISEVVATARDRAARCDEDSAKVESGRLASYLTADEYRKRASSLREFADRLEKTK